MLENIPIEIFNLLIFMMPGFFFFRIFSSKSRTGFEYMVFSLFWGILLATFYYLVLPEDKFVSLVENPYAGAVVFSLLSVILAIIIKVCIEFIRRRSNGAW